MRIPKKRVAKTAQSLLTAANEVFAMKGYRDATIAEICERAKVNIAAVNYHFGDKETLYTEAWRHSFSESIKQHPPDGGVSDAAPPEERLRGQVAALLRRITDEDNREFSIVQKELANPTGLLNKVMGAELRPLQQRIEILVRELLGPSVSNREVQFCEISIISQCINPMVVRKKPKEGEDDEDSPPGVDDIEAYAKHVVAFCLAGIRATRDGAEARRHFKGNKERKRPNARSHT
jgi:TetR/AcrR family transcriptional regulator, regulator of cefoperazone and chloramphenicol sensitivity